MLNNRGYGDNDMGIIFLTYAEMGHGDMLIQQVMGILDAKIDGNILMMFKVVISMRIFDVVL